MSDREEPWKPAIYDVAQAHAVRAVATGMASEHQQQVAINWIINELCGTYAMSFRPGGAEGARKTDFAEGARSVGMQIVKLINMPAQALATTRVDVSGRRIHANRATEQG